MARKAICALVHTGATRSTGHWPRMPSRRCPCARRFDITLMLCINTFLSDALHAHRITKKLPDGRRKVTITRGSLSLLQADAGEAERRRTYSRASDMVGSRSVSGFRSASLSFNQPTLVLMKNRRFFIGFMWLMRSCYVQVGYDGGAAERAAHINVSIHILQPVAKRLSTPNPRYQQPSPEPAAPAPPPPQEKQPPTVSLRPKKLTLLDLKHCGPCAKEHDPSIGIPRSGGPMTCRLEAEQPIRTLAMEILVPYSVLWLLVVSFISQ